MNNKTMYEYLLLFSKYLKKENYSTYDVVFYNNNFYAGIDLFKNFNNYLAKMWELPVVQLLHYKEAKQHFLNKN